MHISMLSEWFDIHEIASQCLGPCGSLASITHGCTGSSLRFVESRLTRPVNVSLRAAYMMLRQHLTRFGDGGWRVLLLSSYAITAGDELRRSRKIPYRVFAEIFSQLIDSSIDHIRNERDRLTNTLSFKKECLHNLDKFISGILSTQKIAVLSKEDLDVISQSVLMSFLSTDGSEAHVRILCQTGSSFSYTTHLRGLLIDTPLHIPRSRSGRYTGVNEISESNLRVLIFDHGLHFDDEEDKSMKRSAFDGYLSRLFDEIVRCKVGLLGCQRKVDSNLIFKCMKSLQGIFVLERLSLRHIQSVASLSDARILSSSCVTLNEDDFGFVEQLDTNQSFGHKRYTVLHGNNMMTILLRSPDEVCADEMKVYVRQTLRILQQLFVDGVLIQDAECHVCEFLKDKVSRIRAGESSLFSMFFDLCLVRCTELTNSIESNELSPSQRDKIACIAGILVSTLERLKDRRPCHEHTVEQCLSCFVNILRVTAEITRMTLCNMIQVSTEDEESNKKSKEMKE